MISKRHMEEYLAPIVSASRDVSRQKNINNPSELKRIVSKLNNDYGNENLGTDQDEAEAGKKEEGSKGAKELPLSKKIGAIVKESSLILQATVDKGIHDKSTIIELPTLYKVPPKRDYGRYFCSLARKEEPPHRGLMKSQAPFFMPKIRR